MNDAGNNPPAPDGETGRRSPGANPDVPESDPSANNGRRGRRGRNRAGRNGGVRSNKFKGECEGLSGYVYDSGMPHSNQDLFATTTRKIGEYVAKTFDHAGEFRLGMVNLNLPPLNLPLPSHYKVRYSESSEVL